jgi:hypothetical protein
VGVRSGPGVRLRSPATSREGAATALFAVWGRVLPGSTDYLVGPPRPHRTSQPGAIGGGTAPAGKRNLGSVSHRRGALHTRCRSPLEARIPGPLPRHVPYAGNAVCSAVPIAQERLSQPIWRFRRASASYGAAGLNGRVHPPAWRSGRDTMPQAPAARRGQAYGLCPLWRCGWGQAKERPVFAGDEDTLVDESCGRLPCGAPRQPHSHREGSRAVGGGGQLTAYSQEASSWGCRSRHRARRRTSSALPSPPAAGADRRTACSVPPTASR